MMESKARRTGDNPAEPGEAQPSPAGDGAGGAQKNSQTGPAPGEDGAAAAEAPANTPGPKPGPKQGGPKPGPKQGGPKKGGPGKKPAGPPEVVEVAPPARAAEMKPRHWGILVSAVVMIAVPLAAVAFYLWTMASDQYASTVGFTVRQEETGSASELLGGFAKMAGGSTSADSDILYEFIQSQDLATQVNADLGLVELYSEPWPEDPLFALWPDATAEDLTWFWKRMVRVSYDQGSGLIELTVLAFDPEDAKAIAEAVLTHSRKLINGLNASARNDKLRYAQEDLDEALERLKQARQALVSFRTKYQIVDPQSDLQGRMGVLNNLQQQLAEALVDYDLLTDTVGSGGEGGSNDPRSRQLQNRIEVIRQRIAEERRTFASPDESVGGKDYPTLMAEYESLVVDREFAEEAYRASLTALDAAREEASRESRYLATYIQPTRAQQSAYPQRWVLFGLAALFLGLLWTILALVYYSIRDRG